MSAPTTLFVRDTFQDTNGTLLTDHTPDTGGAWTRFVGSGNATIQSNRLTNTAASPGGDSRNVHSASCFYASADNDYTVYLKVNITGTPTLFQHDILFNVNPAAPTYYLLATDSSLARIYRVVNGSSTNPLPYDQGPAIIGTGTSEIVVHVTNGGSYIGIVVYINGVMKITVQDTNASRITAAGQAGLRMDGSSGAVTAMDFAAYDGFQLTPYVPAANAFWTSFVGTEELLT